MLHFIWGYRPGDTWGLIERFAIQSAAFHNPDWDVILWTHTRPSGPHWEELLSAVPRLQVLPAPRIDAFNGRPIPRYQHKADVLRHSLLYALGGAYLDLDTITLEPWPEEWLQQEYVVGLEYHRDERPIGLTNAIFLCAPYSRFGWRILSEYQAFDPAVHRYEEFGVNRPLQWSKEMPDTVEVVKWRLLGPMHWACEAYWTRPDAAQGVVVAHLWRTGHNDAALRSITEADVRRGTFTYARAVQAVLNGTGRTDRALIPPRR